MQQTFSVLAGAFMIAGFVPYIWKILRKGAKPAKASWVIWTTLDTITIAGMFTEGTVNGQLIGTIIGAYVTVGLALKFGQPGWTRLDKGCLCGAVLGIVAWAITANPVAAIATSCSVIFLGSIPTFGLGGPEPREHARVDALLARLHVRARGDPALDVGGRAAAHHLHGHRDDRAGDPPRPTTHARARMITMEGSRLSTITPGVAQR